MSIEILNETDAEVDERELLECARFVLAQMHVHPAAELCVRLVDEAAMATLHVQWMDLEGPTDVMSFPMDELRPGRDGAPTPAGTLGDVVICPTVAQAQAEAGGHAVADEYLLLLVHGMLHLLGYDHGEPEEKVEMFALQRTLLLGYLATRGRSSSAAPDAAQVRSDEA